MSVGCDRMSDGEANTFRYIDGYDIRLADDEFDYKNVPYIGFSEAVTQKAVNLDYLLCPVCKNPFLKPYVTKCGHTFCYECLVEALRHTGDACPLDKVVLLRRSQDGELNNVERSSGTNSESGSLEELLETPLSLEDNVKYDISPAPLIVKVLVDDLGVRCLNHQRGCKWTGLRSDVRNHVVNECGYTRVICGGGIVSDESEDNTACVELIERRFVDTFSEKCHHQSELYTSHVYGEDFLQKRDSQDGLQDGESTEKMSRLIDTSSPADSAVLACPNASIGCDWKYEIAEDYFHKFKKQNRIIESHVNTFCRYQKLNQRLQQQDEQLEQLRSTNNRLENKYNWLINSIPFLNTNNQYINNQYNSKSMNNIDSSKNTYEEIEKFNHELHQSHGYISPIGHKDVPNYEAYVKQLIADNLLLKNDISYLNATVSSLQLQMNQLSFSYKQQLFNTEMQRIHTFQQRFSGERLSSSTNESESDLSDSFSRVKL